MTDCSAPTTELNTILTGQHLWIVESETHQPAGLLLCRRFVADLILAGSLVGGGADARGCERVLPLGPVRLSLAATGQARQQGFEHRMQSIDWQKQIISEPTPQHRAQMLLEYLYETFGMGLINTIADGDLAKAAGVLPGTLAQVKQQFRAGDRSQAAA